ncbi:hypothetical protein [Helicobacter sp. T3_23-1059]
MPRGFYTKSIRKDGVGVDCHDSTLRANSLNDGIISPSLSTRWIYPFAPSLAEGVWGWVFLSLRDSRLLSKRLESWQFIAIKCQKHAFCKKN